MKQIKAKQITDEKQTLKLILLPDTAT